MANQATKAKFVKTQGTALGVSKATTLDPTDADLEWADLSVTIKQPQFQGGQSDEIEVTTLASEAKEFTVGLADNGTFSMSGNWKANDEAQTVLRTARDDGEPRAFKADFVDGSKSSFLGLVTQFTWDAAPNGTVNGTFNVRITGSVSFDIGPAEGVTRGASKVR
ncbi:phage tail tube protein [Pseudomonas viridiflava]|uniref:phage tail tube protein n=1 Tax=Pseudomonas viridiflava TaxID=33069 RepID=UPI000F044B6D|nr:phage tail tube protein [Pseudomonas viridiflava]